MNTVSNVSPPKYLKNRELILSDLLRARNNLRDIRPATDPRIDKGKIDKGNGFERNVHLCHPDRSGMTAPVSKVTGWAAGVALFSLIGAKSSALEWKPYRRHPIRVVAVEFRSRNLDAPAKSKSQSLPQMQTPNHQAGRQEHLFLSVVLAVGPEC